MGRPPHRLTSTMGRPPHRLTSTMGRPPHRLTSTMGRPIKSYLVLRYCVAHQVFM